MTAAAPDTSADDLLAPVTARFRAMPGNGGPPSLLPGLFVPAGADDDPDWLPATRLLDGSRLPDLFETARLRWQASPHAAAALAWKAYCYWLALPALLGWVSARRVPLLRPDDVLVRLCPEPRTRLFTLGLRRSVAVAVLPSDPLGLDGLRPVRDGLPRVRVVDEAGLLAALRESLLDVHLTPLLHAIHATARVGLRTLRGSVSSGIAHGFLHAGSAVSDTHMLLEALGLADLVELAPGPGGAPAVRRKTCCLAFTLPDPKVCVGCCIR